MKLVHLSIYHKSPLSRTRFLGQLVLSRTHHTSILTSPSTGANKSFATRKRGVDPGLLIMSSPVSLADGSHATRDRFVLSANVRH